MSIHCQDPPCKNCAMFCQLVALQALVSSNHVWSWWNFVELFYIYWYEWRLSFAKKFQRLHTLTYVDSLSGPPLQKLRDFLLAEVSTHCPLSKFLTQDRCHVICVTLVWMDTAISIMLVTRHDDKKWSSLLLRASRLSFFLPWMFLDTRTGDPNNKTEKWWPSVTTISLVWKINRPCLFFKEYLAVLPKITRFNTK